MDRVKFLDLAKQNERLVPEYVLVFNEIARSGNYVSGKHVSLFEKNFKEVLEVSHAIAVNSGTSALIVALTACGVRAGDEVLVPDMTFVATAEAVLAVGAKPVFVDVLADTWNMDPEKAAKALTRKTKAIIFVHLHGNPSGVTNLVDLAKSKGIYLIEDAAQAHLASVAGKFVGTFGDIAAFSFYPGKNLGALGEAGCVVTNSDLLAEQSRLISNWGSKEKYVYLRRGSNFRMDEIQAAFLSIKLKHLDAWNSRRREIAQMYLSSLDLPRSSMPQFDSGAMHVFHIFSILHRKRDSLREELLKKGIETGIHYPGAINGLSPWSNVKSQRRRMETSSSLAKNFLSLPISESHTNQEINFVIEELNVLLN